MELWRYGPPGGALQGRDVEAERYGALELWKRAVGVENEEVWRRAAGVQTWRSRGMELRSSGGTLQP